MSGDAHKTETDDLGEGLLIDGDDDLLDYFLGNEGGGDGIDLDLKGLPPLSMDEVNDGMAGLLRGEGSGASLSAEGGFDPSFGAGPYASQQQHQQQQQQQQQQAPLHGQAQAQTQAQQHASSHQGTGGPQGASSMSAATMSSMPYSSPPMSSQPTAASWASQQQQQHQQQQTAASWNQGGGQQAPMASSAYRPGYPGSSGLGARQAPVSMRGMTGASGRGARQFVPGQSPGSRGATPAAMNSAAAASAATAASLGSSTMHPSAASAAPTASAGAPGRRPATVGPGPAGRQGPGMHIKEETKVPTGARGASGTATAAAVAAASSASNASATRKADAGSNSSGEAKPGASEEEQERHRRRLERNRESARLSRRRKKENLELLENRVSRLTAELDELRRRHLEEANQALQDRRQGLLRDLMSRMSQGSIGGDALRGQLHSILQETGPSCSERRAMLEHHYKHLFNLILPPYTKFLLWMMNQGEGFFQDGPVNKVPADQSGAHNGKGRKADTRALWSLICTELSLSQEQQEKLRVNYKTQDKAQTRDERERLSLCTMYLEKLRSNIATRTKAVETHTHTLFNILSPEQAVKYVNWVETNRAELDACGVGDAMIFDQFFSAQQGSANSGPSALNEPRFMRAKEVLLKPDESMTLEDLNNLLAIL
ncbi:Hypothetical Protein FCC1311_095222 [Hondaea fermentalgiana]|uniref:BZIP domain-containing protein n=1 Tax=Hondaea fermentalgiana TaxID=2315210 RepID=A0A2R5GU66_9STRA|nr:Hypothetical Protein FCC1311_095222 [Hondaea fermentalgiana]|eukprot:GBG33298.1 Hypothetical Protein FCC1311_095222 [Hondaea fermentalgiana]